MNTTLNSSLYTHTPLPMMLQPGTQAFLYPCRQNIYNISPFFASSFVRNNMMKDLYDITGKLSVKQYAPSKPNKLTRQQDQMKRWAEYFNNLLNRPSPAEVGDIPDALAFGLNSKPTIGEIKSAIGKQTENGRASDPKGITAEI